MLDSLDLALRTEYILDSGPFYNEFCHDQLVKEPWNAYSSLVFFIPIVFWLIKLRGSYKKHWVILLLLPFLFLNGLGSTLYHAFRSSEYFLWMDFMPANLMSIILSAFFWQLILNSWTKSIGLVSVFYLIGFLLIQLSYQLFPNHQMGPNIGYMIVGVSYFLPILIFLLRNKWFKVKFVLFSLLFLGLALLFRVLDYPSPNLFHSFLPQGTHFLWHVFSVGAVFSMGYFVYFINLMAKEDV